MSFFRHADFSGFEILKNFFFKNSDFGYHRKMYGLVPCIPIFREFFLLKVQKGCVWVIMLFLLLVLIKIYFLMCKKSISG